MTTQHGHAPEETMDEDAPKKASRYLKLGLATLVAAAVLIGIIFALQYTTRHITAPTGEAATPLIQRLVTQNYKVEAVGHAVNRDFIGETLAISAGGTVHTCSGLTKEKLEAKEPLTCKDGYTVQPKP